MKKYKTGIFIGKFFPFHNGHLKCLIELNKLCDTVYLILYYDHENELNLLKEFNYNIDLRYQDIKKITENMNVKCFLYNNSKGYKFPDDFLLIKSAIFKLINVKEIDLQIIGANEEAIYSKYIYANKYIVLKRNKVHENELSATIIRKDFEKYKMHLPNVILNRFDK
ncbi:MAG: hypothetical protein R3Y13_02825 [bacterium]